MKIHLLCVNGSGGLEIWYFNTDGWVFEYESIDQEITHAVFIGNYYNPIECNREIIDCWVE